LFNGLDMSKFPSFEEASVKHKLFKNRIKQFLMFYFFPYYSFDIDNTLIYFLAGRYEFHDKGVDVFIRSLGRLNEELKKEKCEKTIVAFFWIPGNVKAIHPELLENKTFFRDVVDTVDDAHEDIHNRLLYTLLTGKELSKDALFNGDFQQDLKPKLKRLKRQGLPPLSTHELYNEDSDQIINAFKSAGLNNAKEDVVKVVFYPIYLSGADGLLDTSYYESMQGSHLGVFPSYYEPWGYTPLEAAALGVSSITTDLAGFGRYICQECAQGRYPGIFVLPRLKKSEEEIVSSLTEMMSRFAHFSAKERTENKIISQRLAATADWKSFIENYIEAHNRAIQKL
jgi:glycogen(starch) synthase